MAHRTKILSRMSPELGSSIFTFVSGLAIIVILHSQPLGAADTDPAMKDAEYPCINANGCIVECGECETPRYKYKFIHDSGCEDNSSRKRRQIPPSQVTLTTITTITPTTTTVKNAWICKNCSVVGCKKCIDEVETPACEICIDGYLLNNVTHTCSTVPEESGLSGVAIAGIVIAVLCIVGIAIVIVLFALRKLRGSSEVTGRNERIKNFSSTGSNVSSNVPQISKINTKELLRKHDQITRYMKDPSSKDSPKNNKKYMRSCSNDHTDVDDLPMAPAPPTEQNTYSDMQPRYDPLDIKTQNDPQLYQPMQPEEGDLYLNTAAVENEFRQAQGLYENTGHRGVTNAHDNKSKHPNLMKPQESIDAYEPLEPAPPVHASQEIYLNNDSELLVQNSSLETDDIYMNEQADDVYQNT